MLDGGLLFEFPTGDFILLPFGRFWDCWIGCFCCCCCCFLVTFCVFFCALVAFVSLLEYMPEPADFKPLRREERVWETGVNKLIKRRVICAVSFYGSPIKSRSNRSPHFGNIDICYLSLTLPLTFDSLNCWGLLFTLMEKKRKQYRHWSLWTVRSTRRIFSAF